MCRPFHLPPSILYSKHCPRHPLVQTYLRTRSEHAFEDEVADALPVTPALHSAPVPSAP